MRRILLLSFCASLVACSGGDHQNLKEWIAENSKNLRGSVKKLPEVAQYQPITYDVDSLLDPFKSSKIDPDGKNRQGTGKGGEYQPDFEARELRNSLLEKYPLESLKMIGTLNINNRPMAVIQVEDMVKQIKVGEYAGLDFGMVTKISDQEVELHELVQDSAGEWSERLSTLYLQSKSGDKK